MNIYQKLQQVMRAVAYIKKDTEVRDGGGYKAVTHDMVTALVRPHFLDAGIIMHPTLLEGRTESTGKSTQKGTPIVRYVGIYDVAFVNAEDPQDRAVVRIEAHAEDTGDKAPGKAVSYACKYAVLKVLMLETGENDESRMAPEPPPLTDAQEATLQEMRDAALNGTDALRRAWGGLTKEQRLALGGHLDSLKEAAAKADSKGKAA
jgi:hypothetical protein